MSTGSTSETWSGSSGAGCGPSSSTRSPTTRTPPGSASRWVGARNSLSSRGRYGFLIVEDVAYRELGFFDETLPSLWSLAPDVVVQTGTTSKTLFPGVRLGWAVGPADISARLVSAKQNTDQCAGALGQRLFEESVRRGWMDDQVARSRALYRSKCDRLLAALERSLPEGSAWTRPQGGFFTWLTLPGADSVQIARRAAEQGVGVVPGTLFFPDGRGADTMRLAYSMVDIAQIDEGIARLGSLL